MKVHWKLSIQCIGFCRGLTEDNAVDNGGEEDTSRLPESEYETILL